VTTEEKRKIYLALSAPFPESAIQRTSATITGKGYDTTGIGYQHVVNRLNEVVGLGSWRTHREIDLKQIATAKGRAAYEAICDLVLELGQWDQEGKFIPFAEALADGGHTAMNAADAKKGSFTNALKKAAAMFGCGRQAYEGSLDEDNQPAEVRDEIAPSASSSRGGVASQVERAKNAAHPSALTAHSIPGPVGSEESPPGEPVSERPLTSASGPSRIRVTSKQLGALWALSRKAGYDMSQFRQIVKQRAGCQPEFLSREVASKFISELSARVSNGQDSTSEGRQPSQEG
jgi:hypothetical protein